MSQETPVEIGVFEDYPSAERAVEALLATGFEPGAISVICPTCSARQFPEVEHVEPAGAHTPGAAATGGVIGSVLGGLTAAGGIAASGTALLVAGPLLAAGAAVGAVTGAFIGAMTTRGLEPEISDFYDQALSRGQILVAVDTDRPGGSGRDRAERALLEAGALPLALRRG